MNHIYRIAAPHFVAGILVEAGKVTGAAPILRYMRGWTLDRVKDYCIKKEWWIELV